MDACGCVSVCLVGWVDAWVCVGWGGCLGARNSLYLRVSVLLRVCVRDSTQGPSECEAFADRVHHGEASVCERVV